MSKKQLNQRQTKVLSGNSVGEQVEQTLTVEESTMPTPTDLEQYKLVDPRFIDFFLETSRKEQEHRHRVESEKIEIIKDSEKRIYRINLLGMLFALLALSLIFGVAAYALYLDHQWFAGVMTTIGVVSIISVFTSVGAQKEKDK